MKLLSLKLVNFQAHERRVVHFSPEITTIKGPTDKGKSSILRALEWVILNSLGGQAFIREGYNEAKALLKLDTKRVIERVRGAAGTNTYSLDGTQYKSFSTSVPTDIATLLQLDEINFQRQHDPPFWFSISAGEVSRRLNAVIDLSVIDSSLTNIGCEVRRAQERKMICKERLIQTREKLKEALAQSERIEQFQAMQRISTELKSAEGRIKALEEIVNQLVERTKNLKTKAPPDFSSVQQSFRSCRELTERAASLTDLIHRAEWKAKEIAEARNRFEVAETAFDLKTKGERCFICGNEFR